MGLTLRELFEENYAQEMDEEDRELLEIIGQIRISDLMQAFIGQLIKKMKFNRYMKHNNIYNVYS